MEDERRTALKIAVLGDIHGNWTAMEPVAADLVCQQVDAVVGLGDYLSTSRGAAPVVEWMRQQPHAYFVRGDNDCWESYERYHPREREDTRSLFSYLTCLPDRIVLQLGVITLLAQHGYPWPPRGEPEGSDVVRRYMSRAYVESFVDLSGVDIACFGDIHMVHVDLHEDLAILHPGSVGVPSDGEPWGSLHPTRRWEPWSAKYLLLAIDGGSVHISLRRVPFSREAAVQESREGHLADPGPDVWLAHHLGLRGPSGTAPEDQGRPWPGPSSWSWKKKLSAG
jgi:predicted phosphodiesterase